MIRRRAVGIVIKDGSVLVMYRKNTLEYYTLPGGGVEDNETIEEAVKREIWEECSVRVRPIKLLFEIGREGIDNHFHYLCDYIDGEPAVQEGTNEHTDNQKGDNLHIPKWVPITAVKDLTLYPEPVKEKLLEYLGTAKKR